MPIQGYTPNKNLVKVAQNSTDNWDVWQNQNLDTLDEPTLTYSCAAAENLAAFSVAVIKDDGTGAKKAYLADSAAYVAGDPLGVVMASALAGGSVRLALDGRVQNGAWSFGPSDKFVYLSGAGAVTATPTSVKLGYVLSATAIYFVAPIVSGGQTDTVAGSNGLQNTGDNIDAVIAPVYGSSANTVCQGNDARLHNQNSDGGTSATSFEINYAGNSARILTTGLTANRDYTLPDATTKLVGESFPASITAQHSFAPAAPAAPFILAANAQGQLVTGLNADKLDGADASAFAASGANSDITALNALTSVNGGPFAKNVIHNGGFTVNQRGYASAATLASGAYGHDRWKAGSGGGDYSFTQLASNTTVTIASGKSLIQVIEDKNVQYTSYVLSWTGSAQARYAVNGATPAGSYASSPILITGQNVGTVMSVEFNAGTLGNVQLEPGSTATPFEMRPYQTELALCQRYLPAFVGSSGHMLGSGYVYSTGGGVYTALVFAPFKTTPRAPITGITLAPSSPTTVLSCRQSGSAFTACANFAFSRGGLDGIELEIAGGSNTGFTVGHGTTCQFNATATILCTGAEL